MKSFGVIALAASASAAYINGTTTVAAGNGTAVWVTDVVTAYTTYCPAPTVVTLGSKVYTVSSATTLTVTDCPCTISKQVTSAATPTWAASSSAPATNGTASATKPAIYTGAANHVAAAGSGLLAVVGAAAVLL